MTDPKPQADENGNTKGFPLLGQAIWLLPNDQILLALEVATTPQELEAMKGQTIQLFLTKIQVMDIARMLTDAGEARYKT